MTVRFHRPALFASVILTLALAFTAFANGGARSQTEATAAGSDAARDAFLLVYEVFAHPRCVNCHPVGNRPLQTDRSVPHTMNVARGLDNKGRPGMRCETCHQQRPLAGAHVPPGVPHVEPFPDWQLAPIEMAIEGRNPGELCRQLKDKKKTGGLGLQDIIFHLDKDPLVLWAFDPGAGRTAIRIPHEDFMAAARTWAQAGAPCPE